VLKVTAPGTPQSVVETIAGNGFGGYSGDGGDPLSAQLNSPEDVALDSAGNLYVADHLNHRVRRVTGPGTALAVIDTVIGNGSPGFSGDGGTPANAQLNRPEGLAFDKDDNLYIADRFNNRIRKASGLGTPDALIKTVVSGGQGFAGDGGDPMAAVLNAPSGVAVDDAGDLYIADQNNFRIRKVIAPGTTHAIIGTVAGNGTASNYSGVNLSPHSAMLANPSGAVMDAAGILYLADLNNSRVLKVVAPGTPLASIEVVAGDGTYGFSGDGGDPKAAQFKNPFGLALDGEGNLYIADIGDSRIRKVTAPGTGSAIIETVAGNGSQGFSGDGDDPELAQLASPFSLAVDAAGSLYIADRENHRIRKVTAPGTAQAIIDTVAGSGSQGFSGDGGDPKAAQLGSPLGVALDLYGNLYITDTANQRIRKVTAPGNAQAIIETVAGNGNQGFGGDGGNPVTAWLNNPSGLMLDAVGNIYFSEQGGRRIRKVTAPGAVQARIDTVAGSGTPGFFGDGGDPLAAKLSSPAGVALDATGNLYIADQTNLRIRKIGPAGGYVDFTQPTVTANVTGTSGTKGWYTSDVTVTWTVEDLESPISVQTGCETQVVTADTAGVTFTCSATSTGGTTSVPITIQRDTTAPVVQLFAPADLAVFDQDAVVNADYGCDDTLSGIASCAGPVVTGAPIDTTTPGANSFAVTATDLAGNTATVTNVYSVAVADPFVLTAPAAGAVVQPGQTVTIQWTGGSATGTVNLSLIDVAAGAVASGIAAAIPNSGSFDWVFPASLPFSGPCGRTYSFYAENSARTTWAYGPQFTVLCDSSAPVITPQLVGLLGSNGWYRGDVSLNWLIEDPESAISSTVGCEPASVVVDTASLTFTCTATSDGGSRTESVTIKRDATRPTSIATPLPAPNAAGWNNTDVTVTFTGTDSEPGSGIASCTPPAVLTTEGGHSGVQGFCTDLAGND
jgi:sugar lactone lactonase YvrE